MYSCDLIQQQGLGRYIASQKKCSMQLQSEHHSDIWATVMIDTMYAPCCRYPKVLTSSTISIAYVVVWCTFGNKAAVLQLFELLAGSSKEVPKLGSMAKKEQPAGKKAVLEFVKTIPKDSTSALALRNSLLSIGCSLTEFLPPGTRKTLMAVVKTPANEMVDPSEEATELLTLASDLCGNSSDNEVEEVEEDD